MGRSFLSGANAGSNADHSHADCLVYQGPSATAALDHTARAFDSHPNPGCEQVSLGLVRPELLLLAGCMARARTDAADCDPFSGAALGLRPRIRRQLRLQCPV